MLYSYFRPFLEVTNDPRRPQGFQLSASSHGFDVRVRRTTAPDPEHGIVLLGATLTDGAAGATGAEVGTVTTSVETSRSILSRPSKMGVCALLKNISDVTHTGESTGYRQGDESHQVRQSLLHLLCLTQHLLNRASLRRPFYLLTHNSVLLQTELQSLKFRKTLADICEKIAKALANDGVRQDRVRSRRGILDALQFAGEK
jgi:hypothetical protein